ncbi:L-histidine N(alpha)-methyltransferase [Pseudanabaena sp. FACHB-2040]|nr:L-histidine N(alpha)-methyltransferase [Pseudanabaena sp. FACHB-2040]
MNLSPNGEPTLMQSLAPALRRDRMIIEYLTVAQAAEAGQDVISGLSQTPKSLPPKYFYDDRGSLLFEQITQLPEYYLTRTETAILERSADAIATLTGPCELVELGSGSATKTRLLLNAYRHQGCPLRYLPVDVSGGILEESARQLLAAYPGLSVHGLVGTYEPALAQLPSSILPARMIAFIGSTLGNLTPAECDQFLQQISQAMTGGDYFLLGVDLQKDPAILEAAYNDSQGITADFNLNMLHHLNWRFQGDFQPDQFKHQAFYNPTHHQIEIYIESLVPQTVRLQALDLTVQFAAGEALLSEISRKFDLNQMTETLKAYEFDVVRTFTDPQAWFGLLLCVKR